MPETPSAYSQVIANNAVFSPRPIAGGAQQHNAAYAYEDANRMLGGREGRAFDPYPADERLRCPPVEPRLLESLPAAQCDFNGQRRIQSYCGAYAGFGGNPGWLPALEIKPRSSCTSH